MPMRDERLVPYRDAVARRVHAVCLDRNLDPNAAVETELNCRIDRWLPTVIPLARMVERGDIAAFEAACQQAVCMECGEQDAKGHCEERSAATCCLSRYLPLVYDAILSVQ